MIAGEPITIFIPCEELEISYLTSSQASLTPIELLVIEAIYDGVQTFPDLAKLFGLGQRPSLDLVLDLWNRGYLGIDLHDGRLMLPKDTSGRVEVERQLRRGGTPPEGAKRLKDLDGTQPPKTMKLWRERLCGHVVASVTLQERPGRDYVAPAALELDTGNPVPAAVAQVIRDELQRSVQRGEDVRLHRFDILSGRATGSRGTLPPTRLLPIKVRVYLDPDGDLRFDVRPGRPLTSVVRRDLARRLEQHAEASPDLPFFRRMREVALRGAGGAIIDPQASLAHLDAELDRARRRVEGPTLPRALELADLHESLKAGADAVSGAVELRQSGAGAIEVLAGDGCLSWIQEALAQAHRQVIIASPTIHYDALEILRPTLASALARGVRVAILWGWRRDDVLDGPVQNALSDLQHGHDGWLMWSSRSARSHARFAIRDGEAMLLPARDPLWHAPPTRREGAGPGGIDQGLVYHEPADPVGGPIAQLLEWVRRQFPEYDVARRILLGADLVPSDARAPHGTRPGVPSLPEAARRAAASGQDDGEDASAPTPLTRAQLEIWLDGWWSVRAVLKDRVNTIPDGVELVEDGQHRSWMRRCLESARALFAVAAPLMTREAVDVHFLRHLAERLSSGEGPKQVVLIAGRVKESILRDETQALARRYPTQMSFTVKDCDASVVMNEDMALITSFDLLSNDGYYLPTTRRRQRSEIGLLVRSTAVVEALRGPLVGHADRPRPPWRPEPEGARSEPVPRRVSSFLQRLLDDVLRSATPAEVFAAAGRWLDAHDRSRGTESATPWDDLQRLGELAPDLEAADPDVRGALRQLVAATLSRAWDRRHQPRFQQWLRWLILELWWHEAVDDCARLYPALIEPERHIEHIPVPAQALVTLGRAADDARELSALLRSLPLDVTRVDADSVLGIGVFACLALLRDGAQDALPLLESHTWPSPWDLLFDRARCYWLDAGRPLPIEVAQTLDRRIVAEEELREGWSAAATAFEEARSVSFTFRLGQHVWDDLFGPVGALTPLGAAIASGDGSGAARLRSDLKARRQSPESLLDRTAAERIKDGTYRGEQRIVRGKRQQCLKNLSNLLKAVDRWCELSTAFAGQELGGRIASAGRSLAVDVSAMAPGLAADAEARVARRSPSVPALRRLLKWLEPLDALREAP